MSSFLHHAYNEFEHGDKQIKEKKIKMSVRSLALKIRQYSEEFNSHLKMLSVSCAIRENNNKEIKNNYVANKNISDKKIIELCCNGERYFEKAYRSILNEQFPFKPLRDMLRYQLTGIYSSFRQLKLLNSVMTPQEIYSAVIY